MSSGDCVSKRQARRQARRQGCNRKPRRRGVESPLTHIEVGENDLHVILLVARNGRVPSFLVELPTALESHLDLAAGLGLQVGVELLHAHKAIAVGVEGFELRGWVSNRPGLARGKQNRQGLAPPDVVVEIGRRTICLSTSILEPSRLGKPMARKARAIS